MSIRKGIAPAHPDCSRTTKLSLQSTLKLPREGGLVGIVKINKTSNAKERCDESANHHKARASRRPSVLPRREHAENIVVFVYRLTKVPSLLGIPPVGVGVTKLSLDSRGIDIAAILRIALKLVICRSDGVIWATATNHLGVFGCRHLRGLGVFLVKSLLVRVMLWVKASSLNNGCSAGSHEAVAQGRCAQNSLREHLGKC